MMLGRDNPRLEFFAFSPDSRFVVARRLGKIPDCRIRTLELETGRELRSLDESSDPGAAAISRNGLWLVSGSLGGAIKLWDLTTGQLQRTLQAAFRRQFPPNVQLDEFGNERCSGIEFGPDSIAFSPDGYSVAGLSNSGVRIWDTARGRELARFPGSGPLAFSPNGKLLAYSPREANFQEGIGALWNVTARVQSAILARHKGPIRVVAFSPGGNTLATGGYDNTVKLWNVATGRELHMLTAHKWLVTGLAFNPDGRLLASASADGGTCIWDPKTGGLLLTLVSTKSARNWLAGTPDGLFDGSEEGMQKLVAWRIGNRIYPPDRFFADYYTPGLLARIFAGERPKPHLDLASLKLPPNVRITSPATATTLKQDRVTVNVEAQDQGGGIAEVRLYQNGKLVGSKAGSRGPSARFSFDVELVPGENILKATALSRERVESNEDWVRVMLDVPELTKPTLYVMVVGINKYEDGSLDLHYARQDGEAIANFFQERGGRLFDSVKAVELFDGAASQARIEEALQQLAQEARPQDVVLYYLAGHGAGLGEQFYFLPHEMRRETDLEGAIRKYGISAFALGEALQRIRAQKQVLILDACEAETALPILAKAVMFRGLSGGEAKAMQMLARSKGVYLIAASKKEQYAGEVPQLGHGVLAYALLAALGEKGEPQAAATPEGIITMMSLLQYVNQQVPELTEKYEGGEKQYPVSTSTGMDFPLMVK